VYNNLTCTRKKPGIEKLIIYNQVVRWIVCFGQYYKTNTTQLPLSLPESYISKNWQQSIGNGRHVPWHSTSTDGVCSWSRRLKLRCCPNEDPSICFGVQYDPFSLLSFCFCILLLTANLSDKVFAATRQARMEPTRKPGNSRLPFDWLINASHKPILNSSEAGLIHAMLHHNGQISWAAYLLG
jgi:hypothetical protein